MPKVGVGRVSKTFTMDSSKGNDAFNKTQGAVNLSGNEPCSDSIEDVKMRLSNAFAETNVVIGNETFSLPEEDGFAYKPAFTIQKGNNLVMVAVDTTDKNEMTELNNLWSYCNHARFFLLIKGQSMNLYRVPYSVTTESSPTKENLFTSSVYTKFTVDFDTMEKESVDIDGIISIVQNFDPKKFEFIPLSDFHETITKLPSYPHVATEIENFFKEKPNEDTYFEFDEKKCSLTKEQEKQFMKCLLGTVPSGESLFRYTSNESFHRILNEKRHSMSSLAIMNDTTEIDYAASYLKKQGIDEELQTVAKDSVYTYITSLSQKRDDLTMWRLYGNDTKGVSIEYIIPEHLAEDFLLARVCYADKKGSDSKLNFIKDLIQSKIGERMFRLNYWSLWQHFFKPYDYVIEQEVRLLFFGDDMLNAFSKDFDIKWQTTGNGIVTPFANFPLQNYPLKIKGLLLGKNYPQLRTNLLTLNTYLQEIRTGFDDKYKDFVGFFTSDFHVDTSEIDNYR